MLKNQPYEVNVNAFFKSTLKIKVILGRTLFLILQTLAVNIKRYFNI